MNPFTFGHYHLAQMLDKTASKFSTSYNSRIYLSHTQNSTKDPLSYDDKIKYAKNALTFYEKIQVTKSKARTVIEVAKELESEGFTDIVLVVGSDRVREFKTLLTKYNGKDYTFNSIKVVSAGERDPDAEGVAGFSASKVRAMAVKGDLEGFKKAVPYLPKKAEELYNKIRKGMGIKEDLDINEELNELLTEGVHDKSIFKAVFLAGGPGSGKDYVLDNTLQGHGLIEINSDKALEFLMDKKGLDKTMPVSEKSVRDLVRGRAKNMTEVKQRLAIQGRNGLIINGTGDDLAKITRIKKALEGLGYDTSMIMVNTSDEISAQRNIERGQRGGRTVPETVRKEKWDSAQNSRTDYAKMFGNNYMEFDNSEDLREAPPDVVKQKKMEIIQLFKNVQEFVSQPPQSEKAEEWVANELEKKDTLPISKNGPEKTPPHGSSAAEESRKLGLQYYGFGRYGMNGKVTYRSVHDQLVAVSDVKKEDIDFEFEELFSEDLRKWFDKDHPEGGWKRINSKGEAVGPCAREPGEAKPKCMSNEKRAKLSKKERASAVAVKRKHDPDPERKGKPINVSNFGKGKLSESYDLSDSGAMNLLLLGNPIDDNDFREIEEEKEVKLLKDKSGRVRVFMLRSAAAREAHTMDGTVLKHKNGYVIKLKEEIEDVEIFKGTIRNWITENRRETTIAGSGERYGGESQTLLSEETTPDYNNSCEKARTETPRPKISLAEIRQRKTQKETNISRSTGVCESTEINEIDRGIEPGISMAGAGESIGRDMGEKIKKKSHKVSVTELTGDETTASISAQKEDELKKVGISMSKFKSKRPIG
jgi:dephospho-CoA kinase